MFDLFIAPLMDTYFQKALIGGSIVAVVAGVVGCLVVLRRMAFLGDALSHAMIAGVAGGYLVMKLFFGLEAHAPGMLLGSLIAAVATVALISFVSRISRVKEDTAIGIMYTGIFALGVVAVSIFRHYIHIDLMHFIMGDILGVADTDLWVSAFVAAIVLTVLIFFFRHFQLATFDPIMAASIGLPVLLLDYALTTCVSLVVVSAVSMVGVILVVGLLITPAATAYLLSDRLDRMMILAALFGVTSVIGGLYLCVWLDSAGGGAIMLFCTLQFLVVLTVAPKYGLLSRWVRLRNLIPQQVVEDVLTTILRHEKPTPRSVIARYVESGKGLDRVLKQMIEDDLLIQSGMDYALTGSGQKEANKVLRAHRLWETYLESIGTPEHDVHTTAHQLEHLHQGDTVEYLDEKLGSPTKDPHGKAIP
ncbi:MAG: metal ABC transporter permease [Desulfobacteraceae bacterium]|nr:MAG: metal ABC transporter permease [Desulfobacteraceae bacterium]